MQQQCTKPIIPVWTWSTWGRARWHPTQGRASLSAMLRLASKEWPNRRVSREIPAQARAITFRACRRRSLPQRPLVSLGRWRERRSYLLPSASAALFSAGARCLRSLAASLEALRWSGCLLERVARYLLLGLSAHPLAAFYSASRFRKLLPARSVQISLQFHG